MKYFSPTPKGSNIRPFQGRNMMRPVSVPWVLPMATEIPPLRRGPKLRIAFDSRPIRGALIEVLAFLAVYGPRSVPRASRPCSSMARMAMARPRARPSPRCKNLIQKRSNAEASGSFGLPRFGNRLNASKTAISKRMGEFSRGEKFRGGW